jgi:hypothetical protein
MGKKPSKRRKQSLEVTQPGDAAPQCPYCGTTNVEKSALSLLDSLFQSNVELCAALRSVGRQMLRVERQDDQSLERIRGVLKRADNIRQALTSSDELPEALKTAYDPVVDAPTPASEYSSGQAVNDAPAVQQSAPRRKRLIRPYSQRILRFPTG